MCGIFGSSGNIDFDILISLGCQSESRGTDSSGLAWIDHLKKSILVSKVVERGSVAFPILLKDGVKKAAKSNCMIGHTRMASTGTVNTKNAHPFCDGNIVFAHNGVISNYKEFDDELGKKECDSMCLIKGIKEKNFAPFQGSVALVWIENDKLHAYRKGNPLFRGKCNGGVYLASEKSMLARVGCKKIKELTEGTIYTFDKCAITETIKVKENKIVYYVGSQELWWKEYEKDPEGWEAKQNEEFEKEGKKLALEEKEELEDTGLGFFYHEGKKHFGNVKDYAKKLDIEYEIITQPDKKIHDLTEKEWEINQEACGGI